MATGKRIPTAKEFERVLRGKALSAPEIRVLQALYSFPGHSATAPQLGKKLGYQGTVAANSPMGGAGRRFAEELGIAPPWANNQRNNWFSIIADMKGSSWTMRASLVTALENTSLVDRASGSKLHIVQGGVENGDKDRLEKAARFKWNADSWVVPKSVTVGDEIVIFISGYGFFATASVKSAPKPHPNWPNRYSAGLTSIRLIRPAVSLAAIKREIPALTWAIYPRSITTPSTAVAKRIKSLIARRRKTGLPDLDDEALKEANLDELRKVALLSARSIAAVKNRKTSYRARSLAVSLYVLRRADGHCEGCRAPAPFRKPDGSSYLEPHHTTRLADDGPDHPARVIGLCPNCHRRAHHADNAKQFNALLRKKLTKLEP